MIKRKYLFKIFIAFFVIAFTFSLLTAIIYFRSSLKLANLSLSSQEKLFMTQLKEKIDLKVNMSRTLAERVFASDVMLDYSHDDDANPIILLNTSNELKKHFNYDVQLGVSNMKNGRVIIQGTALTMKDFYKTIGFDQLRWQEIDAYWDKGNGQYVIANTNQDSWSESFLTIAQKMPLSNGESLLVFFSFYLKDIFKGVDFSNGEGFIILSDKEIKCWYFDKGMNIDDDKTIDIINLGLRNDTLQQGKFVNGSVEYGLHSLQSESFMAKFLYVTPIKDYKARIIIETLLVCIGLVLISLTIIYYASKKIYYPVAKLVNMFSGGEPLSGSEFSFIEKSITAVHDNYQKLSSLMESSQQPLKIKFLKDLITGLIFGENIDEQIEKFKLYNLRGRLSIVIFEVLETEKFESFSDVAAHEITKNINELLFEELSKYLYCEKIELSSRRCCFILGNINTSVLKSKLESVLTTISTVFEIEVIAAYSPDVVSVHELAKCFSDTMLTLEYNWGVQRKSVISKTDIKDFLSDIYYPLDTEKGFDKLYYQRQKGAR
ncbi:MAG: hypothetical protein M0R40_05185 [Firmicutes bacterium]|nr:hypothetical protein [Bacillota bacterium]